MIQLGWDDLIVYLLGILTGAAGSYLGNKYTDRRRDQEAKQEEEKQFREVVGQMPDLISEMREDLSNSDQRLIREFFIAKRVWTINFGDERRFIYYEEEHPRIWEMTNILDNFGYIIKVKSGTLPIYRMTEGFVRLVLNAEKNR